MPLLQSGKERLDCVTHSLQPLVVMHYLAAAGWDAGPDPLRRQHLTDFLPVSPLISNHRCRRRPILEHPISTREVTALPLPQVQPEPPLLSPTPWSLLGHVPLAPPIRKDQTPLVAAGCGGMGFEVGGVKHQYLWLWGIG